ncbi:MAG: hypothetical protein ACPGLV_11105 [Bacteroidia bacterium]
MALSSKIALGQNLILSQFANGFDQPISIANCNDSRLFVIEQKGIIKIIDTAGVVTLLLTTTLTNLKFGLRA